MGQLRGKSPSCACEYRLSAPDHHDRLLGLEQNPLDTLVELVEMATTWHELEYGLTEPVIGPDAWLDFAQQHSWNDPNRITDLMISLSSIARPRRVGRAEAESCAPARARLASVTSLRPHDRGVGAVTC